MMKVLVTLISVILVVYCDPQLDLPHSEKRPDNGQQFNKPDILVIPNSYPPKEDEVEKKSGTSFDFDRDRDQRFGD